MTYYEKIRKARLEKGLSQVEVSEKIGLGKDCSNYSKLELGKQEPRLAKIIKVAKVLGLSLDYLFEDSLEDLDKFNKKKIKGE